MIASHFPVSLSCSGGLVCIVVMTSQCSTLHKRCECMYAMFVDCIYTVVSSVGY